MRFSNRCLVAVSSLCIGWSGAAQAACNGIGNALSTAEMQTELVGNTVCEADSKGGWINQVQQRGSGLTGELWDYKQGPAHRMDPTQRVGTWTISSIKDKNGKEVSGLVTYHYGGAGGYEASFTLHRLGQKLAFCENGQQRNYPIKKGLVSCG